MSMDKLRFRVLRAFGVAPWSEEAKGLTDEMCLEYAAFLDGDEEKQDNASFDEDAFRSAIIRENVPERASSGYERKPADMRAQISAMSDYIEREMRCRDNGFITY